MTRTVTVLVTMAVGSAVLAAGVAAKAVAPVPGDYRGKAQSSVRQGDVHDKPPLSFVFQGGKLKQIDVFMPMACGTGGVYNAFDFDFGNTVRRVPAPNGKFTAVGEGDVESESIPSGTSHVKGTFEGKIVGKTASGIYKVTSADGSGCAGHGTWKAKLFEG